MIRIVRTKYLKELKHDAELSEELYNKSLEERGKVKRSYQAIRKQLSTKEATIETLRESLNELTKQNSVMKERINELEKTYGSAYELYYDVMRSVRRFEDDEEIN